MIFSDVFGTDLTIWYPDAGDRDLGNCSLYNVGNYGYYWSATPYGYDAYTLCFYNSGYVYPSDCYSRALGYSVRCIQSAD